MLSRHRVDAILDFWFGVSRTQPTPNISLWFDGTPAIDQTITEMFETDVQRAIAGGYNDWAHAGEFPCLALIVLLDQFALNIYRNKPLSFQASAQAIPFAQSMVWNKLDIRLSPVMRPFVYLPLEHSEVLQHQNESVRLFEQMVAEAKSDGSDKTGGFGGFSVEAAEMNLQFAIDHRDVIKKFGRFPGRNWLYQRENTPAEEEYLKQGGPY